MNKHKTPLEISKKAYAAILKTYELEHQLSLVSSKIEEESKRATDSIQQLSSLIRQLIDHQEQTRQDIQNLKEQNQALQDDNRYLAKMNQLDFEALFSNRQEDTEAMKRRFVENLKPATGYMRTLQKGNAKLLKKFTELCKKHNFTYWLQSGTLLGAIRHKGFVPWYDDVDVAMFRDDIKRLKKILESDETYTITLIYDYYCKSRQIRFRTKNPQNPCFLDVYIYDYGDDSSEEAWAMWHEQKAKVVDFFEQSTDKHVQIWREKGYLTENNPSAQYIEQVLQSLVPEPPEPKSKKSKAVIWGLDNFSVKWRRLFDWNLIFPTTKLNFEDSQYEAPHEYMKYVERQYGDIYQLPLDIVTHFQHVDQKNINTDAINEYLQQ